MNTKGIKFLAVLAVMVMAFAAVIVLAPTDINAESVKIANFQKGQIDPKEVTEDDEYAEYYISDDAIVKVTGIKSSLTDGITFYVQNGKELEIDVKSASNLSKMITIKSVTSDLQKHTTSTVDYGTPDTDTRGKVILPETEFGFYGLKGQTVTYKAMMPGTVTTKYVNTTSIQTEVLTTNYSGVQQYATITSDDTLDQPTIRSQVTIAKGQSIEVTGTLTGGFTSYGVKVVDADTTTYYAVGADAGSFTMESGDAVEIRDGSINVKNGNASVKAVSVKGDSKNSKWVDVAYADGELDVTGKATAGTLTVAGKAKIGASTAFDIGSSANLVVANNTQIVEESKAAVSGTLTLKNADASNLTVTGKGTIVAQNIKLWSYSGADQIPYIAFNNTNPSTLMSGFTGLIDVSAITESADVKNRFATAEIAANQTFIVVDDTTVTNTLDVYGVLIINPGVTLTIAKTNSIGADLSTRGQYAQIINNGTIIIKTTGTEAAGTTGGLFAYGGSVVNNGTITGSSDANAREATIVVNIDKDGNPGSGFVNNGTITTSKNDMATFTAGFSNKGTMSINSNLVGATTTISNSGSITMTNCAVGGDLVVNMSKGASFRIASATLAADESILIQHKTASPAKVDAVVLIEVPSAETGTMTIRNITVNDTTNSYTKKLDVAGSMGIVKSDKDSTQKAKLTFGGNIDVTSDVMVPAGYDVYFNGATDAKTNMNVSGEFTFGKGVTAHADGVLNLTVTGAVVVTEDDLDGCNYAAAKYLINNSTTVYASFENAMAAAILSDINTVDVGFIPGTYPTYVTVTSDVVIPAGMIVSGEHIVIGDSEHAPLVELESTGMFSFDDIQLVNGMIFANNANDITDSSVHADVKEEDEVEGSVTYMSIDVAILKAGSGDVIALNQDVTITDDDFTIPAGVIINATAGDENYAFVVVNSDLTVNGTLIVDEFHFIATTDDTKSITLNGTIIDLDSDGDSITPWWYTPVGVSYNLTVEDEYGTEEVWYVITALDNLQNAILIADDAKVAVEGDAKLGDLTITGREDMPAEVTFKGDIDAGTLTLDNAIIIAKEGNEVTATFADEYGSITIIGAYVQSKEMSIYSLDENGVYMTGAIRDSNKGTYTIIFSGITGMEDATIGWGYNAYDIAPSILFNGITNATGKKDLIQQYDGTTTFEGTAVVNISGVLTADNGTKLIFNGVDGIEVLGGLVAAEKTSTANPGTIEVNSGWMFIGMNVSDIYDFTATIDDDDYALAAAAVLSGKVVLYDDIRIYAAPGAEIDDSIIDGLYTMGIFVEDDLWFNVIGDKTQPFVLDYLSVPMFNASVMSILDDDGNTIAHTMYGHVIDQTGNDNYLSGYGNIYIVLDYEIFEVKIKTDGSVKAVYIDGILMETGQSMNIFTMMNVAAGTHKVTVEAATGYDADKCVLYTEMGTILPNMGFTFTELDVTEYDYITVDEDIVKVPVVVYNINGTEIQPEPVPPTPEEESQWTVTTILLVILVVLIAIMAVIVALRLNRS